MIESAPGNFSRNPQKSQRDAEEDDRVWIYKSKRGVAKVAERTAGSRKEQSLLKISKPPTTPLFIRVPSRPFAVQILRSKSLFTGSLLAQITCVKLGANPLGFPSGFA
jgi:hypothetical protein